MGALAPCVPMFSTLIGVEAQGVLDYQGRAGIISIVRWNPCLVIFGVESLLRNSALKTVFRYRFIAVERYFVRSEKLQNESSPNFSNFCPGFCPEFFSEFSQNFPRIFRASFCGKRRPEKIHQKSPPFFNAKFPGKHEKIFTKCFWRAGKVILWMWHAASPELPPMKAQVAVVALCL